MTKPWEYIFSDDTLPTSSEQVDRDVIRNSQRTDWGLCLYISLTTCDCGC